LEKKQQFISQIMTSKSPVRSCEDVDEDTLSYAEIKALCAGNPLIAEKMNLDIDVSRLKLLKADYQSQQYRLQDDILTNFPKQIESAKNSIDGFHRDMERLEVNTHKGEEGISPMTIGDKTYTDRSEAGAALIEACKSVTTTTPVNIGNYRGFDMLVSFNTLDKSFNIDMKGSMTHSATLGDDGPGNITRINNAFDKIPQRLQSVEARLQMLGNQVKNAKTELAKPFALEQELADKTARLTELDTQLSLDSPPAMQAVHEAVAAKSETVAAKGKPSVLDALKTGEVKSRQMFDGKPQNSDKPKSADISI